MPVDPTVARFSRDLNLDKARFPQKPLAQAFECVGRDVLEGVEQIFAPRSGFICRILGGVFKRSRLEQLPQIWLVYELYPVDGPISQILRDQHVVSLAL